MGRGWCLGRGGGTGLGGIDPSSGLAHLDHTHVPRAMPGGVQTSGGAWAPDISVGGNGGREGGGCPGETARFCGEPMVADK